MSEWFPPEFMELSRRLMTGAPILDEELVASLGPSSVAPFKYSASILKASVRKVTNEPVICHSLDIALRAKALGYREQVVVNALLHDTVEDKSNTYLQMHRNLASVRHNFGEQVAKDVASLTNAFGIVFKHLPKELKSDDYPFTLASVDAVAQACQAHADTIEAALPGEFTRIFYEVLYFLRYRPEVREDKEFLGKGDAYHQYDATHSVPEYLALKSYRLYVEELVRDAIARGNPENGYLYESALVVKALDLVDNLRTHEVASYRSTSRILAKAEMFLSCTFFIVENKERRFLPKTFVFLYEYLKNHLYEQILERRKAISHLDDTRFSYLGDYFSKKLNKLREKYVLVGDPRPEIDRYRNSIRCANGISTAKRLSSSHDPSPDAAPGGPPKCLA